MGLETLQVGIRPSGGLRLWDIQFNGERIVYELALQEAMMSTGGNTPSQVPLCDAEALEQLSDAEGQGWVGLGVQSTDLCRGEIRWPVQGTTACRGAPAASNPLQ